MDFGGPKVSGCLVEEGSRLSLAGLFFFLLSRSFFLVLSGTLMTSIIGRILARAAHLRKCGRDFGEVAAAVVLSLAYQDWSCM